MLSLRRGSAPIRPWRALVLAALMGMPLLGPAAAEAEHGSIRVVTPQIRLIDGILVDVNASALRDSSNLRLAVMPAGSPDAIADTTAFADRSTPIRAARIRLTLPGGPTGRDEVRLYHIPRFGTAFVVDVRAPVTVMPGVAGAVLARDLTREAAMLGPVRFEAKYRDTPVRVQAQFLRVRPDNEWDGQWFGGMAVPNARQVAVLSLGIRGVVPDANGSSGEVICLMAGDVGALLRRIAGLNPGDAVLVAGNPSSWNGATLASPVLLRNCRFAN